MARSALLAGELRSDYESTLGGIKAAVAVRVGVLDAIDGALRAKEQDPSVTPPSPDRSALATLPDTSAADEAVATHNERADNHERLRTESINTVLDHLLGSRSERYSEATAQGAEASENARAAAEEAEEAEISLRALRDQKLTTSETAMRLTEDLGRVYGRGHLAVRVTDDGKS